MGYKNQIINIKNKKIKKNKFMKKEKINDLGLTEEELQKKLSEEEYKVLREHHTEKPFTGALLNEHRDGSFHCKVCDTKLFESDSKFDSGTGWPSFDKAIEGTIDYNNDLSFGMSRNEVSCHKCGSHLGHVFNDGPTKTGMRYCINSVCLGFDVEEGKK